MTEKQMYYAVTHDPKIGFSVAASNYATELQDRVREGAGGLVYYLGAIGNNQVTNVLGFLRQSDRTKPLDVDGLKKALEVYQPQRFELVEIIESAIENGEFGIKRDELYTQIRQKLGEDAQHMEDDSKLQWVYNCLLENLEEANRVFSDMHPKISRADSITMMLEINFESVLIGIHHSIWAEQALREDLQSGKYKL